MLKNSKKYVKKIDSTKIYDVVIKSPITFAENISLSTKNKIYLKREDLQPTHSFKIRGAYNKIKTLVSKQSVKHVVTASAGNHAQGVAYSARTLKIKATIFMPSTTPTIKIDEVKKISYLLFIPLTIRRLYQVKAPSEKKFLRTLKIN